MMDPGGISDVRLGKKGDGIKKDVYLFIYTFIYTPKESTNRAAPLLNGNQHKLNTKIVCRKCDMEEPDWDDEDGLSY